MNHKKPGWFREFCEKVEPLGFVFDQYIGSGHPRFVHLESGAHVITSLTPSDWRAERNAIAEMERIAGRKLRRDNSGHYHHRRIQRADFRKSKTEIEAASDIDQLLAESEEIRCQFNALTKATTRNAAQEARRLMARFENCRNQLQQHYRHIPPLTEVTS